MFFVQGNAAGDFSDIVRALAAIGWVIVAAVALWLIRDELRGLIGRIRHVQTPLGAADIDPEVRQLEEEVEKSEVAIRQQLPAAEHQNGETGDEILDLTAREPRLGLIRLVTEIEVRARDLASISGHESPSRVPWPALLAWLVESGIVPAGVASSTDLINSVRNRIVHGRDDQIDDREVAASVDAGLRLLRVLDAIPRHGYEVASRLLSVYRDDAATDAYDDVRGAVLWAFDARGQRTEYHVYPTRRAYNQGERVGWQWSFDQIWGEAYWRDPFEDGQVKLAWSSSAEFVGERLIGQPAD
jgi:hypothetical protein